MKTIESDNEFLKEEGEQFPINIGMSREEYEKYNKHIFYVREWGYEAQNHNGDRSVLIKLYGKDTCSIPGHKLAEFVALNFVHDETGSKAPQYVESAQTYLIIPYPFSSLESILGILKTSERAYAQLFYHGGDDSRCYADFHGNLGSVGL